LYAFGQGGPVATFLLPMGVPEGVYSRRSFFLSRTRIHADLGSFACSLLGSYTDDFYGVFSSTLVPLTCRKPSKNSPSPPFRRKWWNTRLPPSFPVNVLLTPSNPPFLSLGSLFQPPTPNTTCSSPRAGQVSPPFAVSVLCPGRGGFLMALSFLFSVSLCYINSNLRVIFSIGHLFSSFPNNCPKKSVGRGAT